MPLPMKTIREVAAELGMPEKEIRAMVDMRKIRAVWKANQLTIAPDEIGKLRRLRKTLPESVQPSLPAPSKAPPAATTAGGAKGPAGKPATGAPSRPGTTGGTTGGAALKRPALKLPPPPPQ